MAFGAERAHQGFVFRHVLGRCRLRRVGTESSREVGNEIFENFIAETAALHHHVAHVGDPRAPAVLIPGLGRHALLERVAGLETGREKIVLVTEVVVLGLGQELAALIGAQIAPAHLRFLQRKVERSLLVAGQLHVGAGIAGIADGRDFHRVGRGRQVADVIAALRVRQNVHRHLVLRILGDHERAHEGLAVGSLHVARDRRSECRRGQGQCQRERNQNFIHQAHRCCLPAHCFLMSLPVQNTSAPASIFSTTLEHTSCKPPRTITKGTGEGSDFDFFFLFPSFFFLFPSPPPRPLPRRRPNF